MADCSRIAGSTLALFYATAACHAMAADVNTTLEQPNSNTYTLGLEAFRDHYQEPEEDAQVDSHANLGSVTGTYTHDFSSSFVSVDARASYGKDDYKSVSGVLDGVDQQEYDVRVLGGLRLQSTNGVVSPYIGLGLRYYIDEGKGLLTNLGYYAYDRRIAQYYMPMGLTYKYFMGSNWTITPNIEYDTLLDGRVNSRLQNAGGYNISNNQPFGSGYGIRGEFMVGQNFREVAWQLGPFFRYWHFNESDVTVAPDTSEWVEPKNQRLQYGAALRVQF